MAHTTISVPSINCGHCKASIEAALARLDGVGQVEVDVAGKRVVVDHDPAKADVARLCEAIEEQGHETSPPSP